MMRPQPRVAGRQLFDNAYCIIFIWILIIRYDLASLSAHLGTTPDAIEKFNTT